eukprot:UC4_evm6s1341
MYPCLLRTKCYRNSLVGNSHITFRKHVKAIAAFTGIIMILFLLINFRKFSAHLKANTFLVNKSLNLSDIVLVSTSAPPKILATSIHDKKADNDLQEVTEKLKVYAGLNTVPQYIHVSEKKPTYYDVVAGARRAYPNAQTFILTNVDIICRHDDLLRVIDLLEAARNNFIKSDYMAVGFRYNIDYKKAEGKSFEEAMSSAFKFQNNAIDVFIVNAEHDWSSKKGIIWGKMKGDNFLLDAVYHNTLATLVDFSPFMPCLHVGVGFTEFDNVLDRTVFVATSITSFHKIKKFDNNLHAVYIPFDSTDDLSYGEYSYFNYMLKRSWFILDLLKIGVTLWIIESDAVWLQNPINAVLTKKGDIVTANNAIPPRKELSGGFLLLRPTQSTIKVWAKMIYRFESILNGGEKGENIGRDGSEQAQLNILISRERALKVVFLPVPEFISGLWYRGESNIPEFKKPMVIQNNWVVGNNIKMDRAKKHGHWYLNDDAWYSSCRQRSGHSDPAALNLFFVS